MTNAPLIDVGGGFRATRQGYHNDYPDFPANKDTGNGVLVNSSDRLLKGAPNQKLWLFVTAVATGWKLSGAYAQTQSARTFYPQHLSQDEMVIRGQCANQYEYDKIVEFVSTHHQTALGADSDIFAYERSELKGAGGASITFALMPYMHARDAHLDVADLNPYNDKGQFDDNGRYTASGDQSRSRQHQFLPLKVDGYITSIKAGAERFKNAPEFELKIKVTHDYLQEPWQTARIGGVLFQQYLGQFGPFYQDESGPVLDSGAPLEGPSIEDSIGNAVSAIGDEYGDAVDAAWNALTSTYQTVTDLFRNES